MWKYGVVVGLLVVQVVFFGDGGCILLDFGVFWYDVGVSFDQLYVEKWLGEKFGGFGVEFVFQIVVFGGEVLVVGVEVCVYFDVWQFGLEMVNGLFGVYVVDLV